MSGFELDEDFRSNGCLLLLLDLELLLLDLELAAAFTLPSQAR